MLPRPALRRASVAGQEGSRVIATPAEAGETRVAHADTDSPGRRWCDVRTVYARNTMNKGPSRKPPLPQSPTC
jgi:hypothetical protein